MAALELAVDRVPPALSPFIAKNAGGSFCLMMGNTLAGSSSRPHQPSPGGVQPVRARRIKRGSKSASPSKKGHLKREPMSVVGWRWVVQPDVPALGCPVLASTSRGHECWAGDRSVHGETTNAGGGADDADDAVAMGLPAVRAAHGVPFGPPEVGALRVTGVRPADGRHVCTLRLKSLRREWLRVRGLRPVRRACHVA